MKILKAVLVLVVILGIIPFFWGKVFASAPFEENFEAYDNGILSGQGYWYSGGYSWSVVDTTAHTGTKSIKSNSYIGQSYDEARATNSYDTTGDWEFYFKLDNCSFSLGVSWPATLTITTLYSSGVYWSNMAKSAGILFKKVNELGTDFCQIYLISNNGASTTLYYTTTDLGEFNDWTFGRIYWSDIGSAHKFGVQVGDQDEYETEVFGIDGGTRKQLLINYYGGDKNEYSGYVWLDDFAEYQAPATGSIATIAPTTPTCGYAHSIDFASTTLTGQILIGENSPNIYNKFAVYFEDAINPLSEKSQWHFYAFTTSSAGDIVNYSYTATLWSPTSTSYNLNYYLGGYNASTGQAVFENLTCGTITPLLGVDIQEIEQYSTYTTSSWEMTCDELEGAEWWLCRLNNMIEGIFLPSQAKISELKTNLNSLNQKFPQNYINAFTSFLNSVRTGINSASTTALGFKIWGQSGTTSFDFWNGSFIMLGTTQTIAGIFRGFGYFASLLIFILWSLNFGKRIFK